MYTPDINLKIDLGKESDMFVKFLHHEKFTQNRDSILHCYPDLRILLETDDTDESKTIRTFLEKKYSEYNTVIESIVSDSKEKIRKYRKTILEQLSSLMDYTWSKKHSGYLVILTILPFSPFNENTLYFSMARKIKASNKTEDSNHEFLPVLAHEISHFMLRDILEQDEKIKFSNYGWITRHFLQEILAPILMNQEPLKTILSIENYLGNPYLKHLNVEKDSVSENIVNHYNRMYESMKYDGKRSFTEIIKVMADELESVSASLEEKFKMWNAHGQNLFSDEFLLQKYKTPIPIK